MPAWAFYSLGAHTHRVSRAFEHTAVIQSAFWCLSGVLAAAYGFEQAVGAMASARARGGDRRTSFTALARGEDLLFAIRGALGRGEVGLVSAAPPPVDFESP